MKGRMYGLLFTATIVVAFVPVSSYALPHGCVSVTDNYSLSPDVSRRNAVARVNTNTPCTFFFAEGDTFSGSGEYKVSCKTGGVATDSLAQGPQYQIPIPQPCAVGAIVTINAGHAGQGGAVVAGSPTYVGQAMSFDSPGGGSDAGDGSSEPTPRPSSPTTYSVRYVAVGGYQGGPINVYAPGPLPPIEPVGVAEIIPVGTKVTVTIADDVVPGGSFLFSICQRNTAQSGDYYCGYGKDDRTTGDICYTGPKTLRGVTPGNPVWVSIWGTTDPCPDSPTTGILTIVG